MVRNVDGALYSRPNVIRFTVLTVTLLQIRLNIAFAKHVDCFFFDRNMTGKL